MKIIGVTGGIGSGKTTVCKLFERKGVPVYYADDRAKAIYSENMVLRNGVINLLGAEAYIGNQINKAFVSSVVFHDKVKLEALNDLVHPIVKNDFENWAANQTSGFVIKEAAILFESGSYKTCDMTILIKSHGKDRVERVKKRDGLSDTEIQNRMDKQWTDEQKEALADLVLENDKLNDLPNKVDELYSQILKLL